ncbi:hypothetical protein K0M31_003654, partial [Melipona bicolor]
KGPNLFGPREPGVKRRPHQLSRSGAARPRVRCLPFFAKITARPRSGRDSSTAPTTVRPNEVCGLRAIVVLEDIRHLLSSRNLTQLPTVRRSQRLAAKKSAYKPASSSATKPATRPAIRHATRPVIRPATRPATRSATSSAKEALKPIPEVGIRKSTGTSTAPKSPHQAAPPPLTETNFSRARSPETRTRMPRERRLRSCS